VEVGGRGLPNDGINWSYGFSRSCAEKDFFSKSEVTNQSLTPAVF
jgi:hypothetical protein